MQLYIVGKYVLDSQWEFVGVFDSKELALAACISEKHFIGPATLNHCNNEDATEWSVAYYPLLENEND